MKYVSTRGQTAPVSFSEAVALGLAPDGGLFLPEELPNISGEIANWRGLSYAELCAEFFKKFATDIAPEKIDEIAGRSYTKFTNESIAPLVKLSDDLCVLELFHGPTLAFKDFALQFLGNLYEAQIEKTGKPITVLGATSGDTGAAAIHGLLGKKGVQIFILYPDGRVSPLQERQMTCTGAENVHPLAIEGSFDDAQRALKEVFEDLEFKKSVGLSAVNSINLARILAQCVYYLYAWLQLPEERLKDVQFVVPTGNFGNVLAGWLLTEMGVNIPAFKVATNQNDILYRFFQTGEYSSDEVKPSLAPSMDIQIASNFERLIYFMEGKNSEKVCQIMKQVKEAGHYQCQNFNQFGFSSSRTDDAKISEIIEAIHEKYGYVSDPHTACGFNGIDDGKLNVVLSTAHPAKFPETIVEAIGQESTSESLEVLKSKELVKHFVDPTVEGIQSFILKHRNQN